MSMWLWVLCVLLSSAVGKTPIHGTVSSRWSGFLSNVGIYTCDPNMPYSFDIYPADYYLNIPPDQQVSPKDKANSSVVFPECGTLPVPPENQDAYTFQSERKITQYGLNIYDGSVWMISLSLAGNNNSLVNNYYNQVLKLSKTCEFNNILGDAQCNGVMITGDCKSDCGFCYGDNPANQTLVGLDSWYFKAISPIFTPDREPDARCPEHLYWNWNTWDPVLGENSWARLIGPLQSSFIQHGNVSYSLIDDCIQYLTSLKIMQIPETGAIYYAPHNTYKADHVHGAQISTENQVSTLAGLHLLSDVINRQNYRTDQLQLINYIIEGIKRYLVSAYDPLHLSFRSGMDWDWINKTAYWYTDYAVDCQTWSLAVLGEKQIDNWFGVGTTQNIIKQTLKIGGYKYDGVKAYGLGYSDNQIDQVLSGEWTLGGINTLFLLAANTEDGNWKQFCMDVANAMRQTIENEITIQYNMNGVQVDAVLYANKRYFIPFGWWANSIPATSSTGWALLVDSSFNPFYLGGAYKTYTL